MRVIYFYRPKMKGVFSIETVFSLIKNELKDKIKAQNFICTTKWKRFYSFFRARKYQGDINHITGDIHTIALFLDKNKTILTVHDIEHYESMFGIKKIIFKKLWLDFPLKKVNHITTISEFTKKKIVEVSSINPQKISVIYNPAPEDFKYCKKVFDTKNPVILQIGGKNNKNLFRLIEAIKNTCFKLLLVRKYDENLEKILKNYNIQYEWKFDLSREEIYLCYKKCDIVFFASEYEGFGVPILEANAVGRAVITSNITSMPEIAGDSALLVDPFSIKEIRNALFKLKEDENMRLKLIEKGRKNLERFNSKLIANQYFDLYRKIYKEMIN